VVEPLLSIKGMQYPLLDALFVEKHLVDLSDGLIEKFVVYQKQRKQYLDHMVGICAPLV